jgi:hypothetical protein
MRNFIKILFLSFVFLSTVSCQKEEIKPNNNVVNIEDDAELVGINWILSDGRLYTENLDNNDLAYYDHFGLGQNTSTLDPFDISNIPFDDLVQDVTTWNFGNSNFTLNGTLGYTQTGSIAAVSVNGLEDGSSRSIVVLELTEDKLTVQVGEGYGSDGTSNFYYFSTLTFVRQGTTCTSCQPNALYGYVYGGVITTPTTTTNDLVGTKWVVTKFYDGFANNYPNDTLDFVSNTQYTINGGTTTNYTMTSIFGNNMVDLTLYNFYTIGGDYSGLVPDGFITNGQINSATFSDIFGTGNDKLVWMTRIQ